MNDDFDLTEAQRAALAENEAALAEAGSEDWARIYTSHLEMRPHYAYIEDDDAVLDLRDPSREYSWRGFCNLTAGSSRTVIGPRGGERQVLIAQDWLVDPERITLKGRTFHPNRPRITANLFGQRSANLWSEPGIVQEELPEDWESRAEVFTRHLAYLIPDLREHDLVLKWFAHLIQRPEQLPGWHLLLIAERTFGTGRNWIAHCLALMFPRNAVEDLPLKRLLEGKHNSEIEAAILGVVDEIHEGGRDQWEKEQELRSFLTAKTRMINPKFIKPYPVKNFLRVLMFSNHLDALPIPEDDRRHFVARCSTIPQTKEYYDALYDALEDRANLRSIFEFLMNVDLEGFEIAGRAPASDIKSEMVKEARGDEETELRRIIAEWPSDVMRSATLRSMLQKFRDNDLMFGEERHKSDQLSTGLLRRLYRVCGVKALGQVRMTVVDQQKIKHTTWFRIVAIRNVDLWKKLGENEIRGEVERGEAIHEGRSLSDIGVQPQ